MNDPHLLDGVATRTVRAKSSYRAALSQYRTQPQLARICWGTWIITIGSILVWCFTASQVAQTMGAHSLSAILTHIFNNAINTQPNSDDALTTILIRYGAKENNLILQGQYWRFLTPIFLHVNLLHVGLNMLNLVILGTFLERLVGHLRFLLIYLITGIISIIASFVFAPDVISVGASGAIFGLVGAYSIFVLVHRRAFPRGGLLALLWLVFIVGINLAFGFMIANVDNNAHIGGLISGCILGWWFTPLYRPTANQILIDTHRLSRSWPLALLTILGTLLLAILALHLGH
ncbi:rhomboid family intramembrane serine protease [Dictyobacter kobayashii]|uniref:rhomboid family intramembrane serine protease n=1 Tax=Dictyobacter kobayashii TaxID=2014872 RepID=UPI0010A96461|nr:rhomboid family intramembrane serine protease [Dictyobacter kobayashii]